MTEPDKSVWFEQKRYGYGAGFPVAWQGWALLGGFLAAILFAAWLDRLPGAAPRATACAIVIAGTAVLLVFARRHTRGGWRWRWGGE